MTPSIAVNPEMMKLMNMTKSTQSGKNTKGFTMDEFGVVDEDTTAGYLTEEQMSQMQAQPQYTPTQKTYQEGVDPMPYRKNPNSKLPAAIQEAMEKNQGAYATITHNSDTTMAAKVAAASPRLVENVSKPTMQNNSGIDYTILKGIIKECLDEKLKEYSKQNLNECKNVIIKDGAVKFFNANGDVYGAKLKYIGNVNDKKK